MGKNKWRNKRKGGGGKGRVIQAGRNTDFVTQTVANGNAKFEAYYAVQGLHHTKSDGSAVSNFEEWNAERMLWRTALGEVLPASFRFCLYDQLVPVTVKQQMEANVRIILQKAQAWDKDTWEKEQQQRDTNNNNNNDNNDRSSGSKRRKTSEMHTPLTYENLTPQQVQLTKLPFGDYCYQLNVDKNIIRKHPALKELHQWLMQNTDCGHVTRQEAVSMIPPIVLLHATNTNTISSGETIFDMCAAPGSKTSQLLEGLAARDTTHELQGLLVANDVNPSRAHMLTHQLKRILGHYPAALMTAAPAQHFPASRSADGKFDKILADVPCSGDGTTRKNIGVWSQWSQLGALGLHKLQFEIAWKGVSTLLKMGGYMCYSTCSLNPIEDEAVVAELLRKSEGNLELVDIQEALGGFVTRPGVSSWKVFVEPLSNRQQKSRDRKNNPRMQAKRAEYEQKVKEEKEAGGATTTTTTSSNGEDTKNAEEEATTENNNGSTTTKEEESIKEETPDVDTEKTDKIKEEEGTADAPSNGENKKALPKFEPTSMDPEYLMKQVLATGLVHVESMEHATEQGLDSRIQSSNFPPTPEEAAKFHLNRCIRVVSHDNNTGGFFVALLKKTGPIGGSDFKNVRQAEGVVFKDDETEEPLAKRVKLDEQKAEETAEKADATMDEGTPVTADAGEDDEDGDASKSGNGNGNRNPRYEKEFRPVNSDILEKLLDYYGLTGPKLRKDLFMTRSGGDTKNIFWVAPSVKDLFDAGMNIQNRVNIVSTGLKAFTRNNTLKDCDVSHRVAQEAIQFLAPYMSDKRKFSVSMADFEQCLNGNTMMKMEVFSEAFRTRARALDLGCFVVILEGYEERLHEKMIAVMWRCKGDHVNTLVSKADKDGLLSKLAVLKQEQQKAAIE